MLAPAEAQAPAMIDSSQGWSVARMVSSVTPRASSKPTLIASLWPACSLAPRKRAWRCFGGVGDVRHDSRPPPVPDPGTDAPDIGGGQDRQQLHLFDRLHHRGEIFDGLAVR